MNNHQPIQQLLALYDQLTVDERAQVDHHLQECDQCTKALAAYRHMDQGLQQMLAHKRSYLTREPAPLQQHIAAARLHAKLTPRSTWATTIHGLYHSPRLALQIASGSALILLLVFLAALLVGRNPFVQHVVTATTPTTLLPTATAIVAPTVAAPLVINAAEDATERVTVRFVTYDWAVIPYEPLVTAFEQANPDLNVEIISFPELFGVEGFVWPDDADVQMLTEADVVDLFISPRRVTGNLVRDLTPFIAADPTFAADDFYPNTLSTYQWDGGTWGLPTAIDANLIYYDKDLFDEVGVPYPQPGWTWEEFAQTAQAVTQRSGDEVTVWGFVNTWGDHLSLIESQTGPLFDTNTTDLAARLQEPAVIDAVQRYAALFRQAQASPFFKPAAPDAATGFTPESSLVELSQAAMWTDMASSWQWRSDQRRLGVVPYPVNVTRQNTTVIYGQGRTLSAKSMHPEAAWRWLSFLSHQDGGEYTDASAFPLRPSLAEAKGVWQKMAADAATVMRYALAHSYSLPHDRPYVVEQALADAIAAALGGETTVAAALANVPTAAERLRQTQQATTATATPASVSPVSSSPVLSSTPIVTITYLLGDPSADAGALRTLAQAFQQSHPAIHVAVDYPRYQPTLGLQQIAAAADCFDWSPINDNPAERNVVLNLEPFLAAAPDLDRNDFYSGLLTRFTLADGVWGLPSEARPKVIAYNKDRFDAVGAAYPTPTWTTADFAALAKQLTQGTGRTNRYGFVGDSYELADAELFLKRRGGTLYDLSSNPPGFAFTNPATVAAIAWYTDLTHGQGVKPLLATSLDEANPGEMTYQQRWALINSGRAGMWTTVIGVPTSLYQLPQGLNTGLVPLPVSVDGKPVSDPMYMAGYYISASSAQPQACWEWIRFLTEQPAAVLGIPARRSVVESTAYRQQVGVDSANLYTTLLTSYAPPADELRLLQQPWLNQARLWWEEAYRRIVRGEVSAEEALQEAQQQATAYRTCVMDTNAFTDEAQQQFCVKSVVSSGQ